MHKVAIKGGQRRLDPPVCQRALAIIVPPCRSSLSGRLERRAPSLQLGRRKLALKKLQSRRAELRVNVWGARMGEFCKIS